MTTPSHQVLTSSRPGATALIGLVLSAGLFIGCYGGEFLLGQPCRSDADCGSLSCNAGICDGGPCVPNPCEYGGTCWVSDGAASCECPEGFSGERCDPCDPNPCEHGTCATAETGAVSCECDPGWRGPRCDAPPRCGDGFLDPDEECDDDDDDSDECAACRLASCGDGFVRAGVEECDDGNGSNTDGCRDDCTLARCGDGYAWSGVEECDDGNGDNEDACLDDCTPARCGDGFVWEEFEDCDGPTPYECTPQCRFHYCGDGYVWEGVEECDDGNGDNEDACLDDCTAARCGDGYVWEGVEECEGSDLGSDVDGQTCEGLGLAPGPMYCAEGCVLDMLGCGVSPGMVVVPGGVFEMGSSLSTDQEPIREVYEATFWIDQTEVTVDEYAACVADGVCTEPSTDFSACNWMVAGREDHPMNCVLWEQADAYCGWVDGGTGRLPTEAEWEKAARGTDGRIYPWGDAPAPNCAYVVMGSNLGWTGCVLNSTWPVGSMPAGDSPYGVHDMSGNVSEWVADWYGPYDPAQTDEPTGPVDGTGRIRRGGSFRDISWRFRTTYRDTYFNATESGFRCVKTPPGAP